MRLKRERVCEAAGIGICAATNHSRSHISPVGKDRSIAGFGGVPGNGCRYLCAAERNLGCPASAQKGGRTLAVTGFWPVKGQLKAVLDYADNPDKTTPQRYLDSDLYDTLKYAANDAKTDRTMFVAGINCSKQNAYAEMAAVQKRFGNRGSVVAYHGIQSFREGEITPETAFEIGKETARRMWGDRYQVLVTVHLNTENIHCHLRNNFNRPFQASAMTLLLKNRKYIGDYCYGDMIIPGGVPALVEKDVFERVQRRMEANKKSPGRAKAKEEYLLSGKVFCGTCGGHMVGECGKSRNGTFYYYYKCINAKHGHTCKRKALKRDWLERAVVVETVTKVLTDEVIDRVADAIIAIQGQENPMIPSIKEQLRSCDKGLKNLLKAIEVGIFTSTTKERIHTSILSFFICSFASRV